MDATHLKQYLERIGIEEDIPCTIDGMERIQRAHLEEVPFENLDIMAGNGPLALDEESLFDKIVNRRRGGICYELNFLYARVLEALGFKVHLLGTRVYDTGTEFDHVTLLVEDPEDPDGDPWITDVGFAYNFAAPLRFSMGEVQDDGRAKYFFIKEDVDGETWYALVRRSEGDEPVDRYERVFVFRLIPRAEEEYYPRATYYATSPDSRFMQGPLVCIDGEEGRTTLSMHHFIETKDGVRTERDIEYPGEFDEMLSEVFKMRM